LKLVIVVDPFDSVGELVGRDAPSQRGLKPRGLTAPDRSGPLEFVGRDAPSQRGLKLAHVRLLGLVRSLCRKRCPESEGIETTRRRRYRWTPPDRRKRCPESEGIETRALRDSSSASCASCRKRCPESEGIETEHEHLLAPIKVGRDAPSQRGLKHLAGEVQLLDQVNRRKRCPESEGIETSCASSLARSSRGRKRCPESEGIETLRAPFVDSRTSLHVGRDAPSQRGLKRLQARWRRLLRHRAGRSEEMPRVRGD